MPQTVRACFEAFNREIVNLDSGQNDVANRSRDWLIGQIHSKCTAGVLPASYSEKDMKFGSFARKTKIRPLDDIDIMICFKGQGGKYHPTKTENVYDITMPDRIKVLSALRNDNGTLNSRKVVENLKAALINVPQYQNAVIQRNKEVVTLQLSSYDWNFDIVPCFHTDTNFYLIPDGQGRWKPTNPKVDKLRLEEADKNVGMTRQIIRTMKFWKNRIWGKTLESYAFEQMVLSIVERMELYDIQRSVYVILENLSTDIMNAIPDPKGYQGDLNTLNMEERQTLSVSAVRHATLANNAYMAEVVEYDHAKAIGLWRNVFGDDFPLYG